MKRTVRATVLSLSLLAATAGTALGHECYVVNRSEQGTQGAANSKIWIRITLSELFAQAHTFFGGPALTSAQREWAVSQATASGIPSSFAIFGGKKTIGENAKAYVEGTKAADGTGVDWFFSKYGGQLAGIFFAAQARS